jgi:hypothetical protein
MDNADGLLLAVDVVLCKMLTDHIDPELLKSDAVESQPSGNT